MTTWLTIVLTCIGVLLLPLIGQAFRGVVKCTRMEYKLDNVVGSLQDIVKDKDKVHQELSNQMREDRKATNERLTWLERNVWKGKESALRNQENRRKLSSRQ